MRIAYIINSLEGGGAAFPIPSILSLMRSFGAEVKVFALTKKDGKALIPIQNAQFECSFRQGGVKDHWQAYQWLDQQIKQYHPTHLWTSLTRATLLGQLIGAKHYLPVTSWQHAGYLKPWNRRLLKNTQKFSKLWIADSNVVAQLTKQRLNISDHNIITWPIFQANPNAPQTIPWHSEEPIKIITIGRLHSVKGYDILIQAIKILHQRTSKLPSYTISIYGHGDEYQRLQSLIQQYNLGNYIYLCGFTNKVPETLAKHHLYIQPSLSEGFCIAGHEAMLAGLPIIASHVGELSLSVENHITGYTIPPKNPIALANTLEYCLKYPEKLSLMGQNARQKMLNSFSKTQFEQIGRTIFDRMNNF